jgi:hypothetical protein
MTVFLLWQLGYFMEKESLRQTGRPRIEKEFFKPFEEKSTPIED